MKGEYKPWQSATVEIRWRGHTGAREVGQQLKGLCRTVSTHETVEGEYMTISFVKHEKQVPEHPGERLDYVKPKHLDSQKMYGREEIINGKLCHVYESRINKL